MPDELYFVTWCDPAKYNIGPEQEYKWFSELTNAEAFAYRKEKTDHCEHVLVIHYQRVQSK
jgi:hypothetical protein